MTHVFLCFLFSINRNLYISRTPIQSNVWRQGLWATAVRSFLSLSWYAGLIKVSFFTVQLLIVHSLPLMDFQVWSLHIWSFPVFLTEKLFGIAIAISSYLTIILLKFMVVNISSKNSYFLFRLNSHLRSPILLIIHEFVEIYPSHICYTQRTCGGEHWYTYFPTTYNQLPSISTYGLWNWSTFFS